jgi:4'-phosphopantetheinyl transferase
MDPKVQSEDCQAPEKPQSHLLAPILTLFSGRNEVHVWRAGLDLDRSSLSRLQECLSADERARAARFVFAKDRERFIAARSTLRRILGQYLGMPPGSIAFAYSAHGKPFLSDPIARERVSFNLSHCDDVALYAIAAGCEVGVDLERLDREIAVSEIAGQYFCPAEVAAIHAMAPEHRHIAFFVFWCRKEAYVKARGEGLSIPLNEFDVSSMQRPLRIYDHDRASADTWFIHDLSAGSGFAAALAVKGLVSRIRYFTWRD